MCFGNTDVESASLVECKVSSVFALTVWMMFCKSCTVMFKVEGGGEEEEAEECFAEGIVQPLAAAVLGSMRSSQSIVQACYCRPMRGTNTGLRKRRVHNACRFLTR